MADVSQIDIQRIENRISELIVRLEKIILLEERQAAQGERIGALEQRMKADEQVTAILDKTMSSWINRGIGVWLAAAGIFAIVSTPSIIGFFKR